MKVMETIDRRTGTISLLLAGTIVGILLVALAYILSVRHKLRRASRPGREVSASISPTEMP
jgi:hypothetical protein